LFGYEKGAFTGAVAQKRGRIEQAEGGTLFLDEIGDLSPVAQAKLLRFLQDHTFVRVGGLSTITVDTRVVAATNVDLDLAMTSGEFRADLYYRLSTCVVRLPGLNEHPEDIPLLVEHLIAKHQPEFSQHFDSVADDAMQQLKAYQYGGNVREMENFLQEAMALAQHAGSSIIKLGHLRPRVRSFKPGLVCDVRVNGARPSKEDIIRCLNRANGVVVEAARSLGVTDRTLRNWMKKHDLHRPILTRSA
jgi:transcriptional regulator with GAF, ATPase, and Fis domain